MVAAVSSHQEVRALLQQPQQLDVAAAEGDRHRATRSSRR